MTLIGLVGYGVKLSCAVLRLNTPRCRSNYSYELTTAQLRCSDSGMDSIQENTVECVSDYELNKVYYQWCVRCNEYEKRFTSKEASGFRIVRTHVRTYQISAHTALSRRELVFRISYFVFRISYFVLWGVRCDVPSGG